MKTIKLFLLAVSLLTTALAQGQTNVSYFNSVNTAIPDANPTGLASSTNLSGVIGYVSSVTVTLDITGGFNGDLYAFLTDPNGNLAVLLNRPGVGSANAFGYGNTGFQITLDSASANNIHGYGASYATNGLGQVTGSWLADGRAIDPQSLPTVFDGAPTLANLSLFTSGNPNGQWTLFLADLSGGGQSTLVSWGLTITTVPEPQTWAMAVGGLAVLLALNRRRSR